MLNQATGKQDLIKAGITIVLGLIILGLFIIAFGGHRFWESLDSYYIKFNGVKNLSVGRPVKYAGINVGRVLSIDVDPANPGLIQVEIGVDEDFTIYQGTRASVTQKGLVGDNYILLNLSGKAGGPLPEHSVLPSYHAADMMETAAAMANMARELTPKLSEIASSLATLLNATNRQQISTLLAEVKELVTTTNQSLTDLSSEYVRVAKEAQAGVGETRLLVKELRGETKQAMRSLTGSVNRLEGESVTTLKALATQTNAVGSAVESLTKQLQQDLDYDQAQLEEILDNTADLTHNLKVLSQSLKERPWQIIYRPEDKAAK